ncbi:putative receptor-like serine/threonine-protein kinase [Senna tora]|uniref:Putative receptor-like serine/threonine-protein kinase n=1 Tax=Senna tora TaxID=362788 RepID=A0A834SLF3_9FABA|nr:putative receptor-like serine/threonine-protein kinase [Senna tora]
MRAWRFFHSHTNLLTHPLGNASPLKNSSMPPMASPQVMNPGFPHSFASLFVSDSGYLKGGIFFCVLSENLVGKGGYAEVYKGTLKDGDEIAVKRLTRTSSDERKEKEFLTEIGTIGHVHHPNVLPLRGCCIDKGLYLVFQLSSKGSVASLLHDQSLPPMDWKTRHKIVLGTARGLHYLHKGSKWLPNQWTHHSIAPIEGTFGHLAPEYYLHGIVDEKTDVFAFGVFMLEVISGRKPVDGKVNTTFGLFGFFSCRVRLGKTIIEEGGDREGGRWKA